MIFGNIQYLDEYPFLEKTVQDCFAYAKTQDLGTFEPGCHEIDGKRLFVNIAQYTTTDASNRFWEAHRKYLDLHLMLRGEEQIDLNFTANMKQQAYQEQDDFLPLDGEKNSSVILQEGDFLICVPHDAHRTAVQTAEPSAIKKAIFKIQLS